MNSNINMSAVGGTGVVRRAEETRGRSFPGLSAEAVRALKARDNTTNWIHLARVWAVVAATIGAMIALEHYLASARYNPLWALPAALVAIAVIGASQHQLGGVIHEGTHFLLFENRMLNEFASDWFAAFAIYTSTYQYRVHHLAHHQFVNDPVRDPDISQLKDSDHWLDFPVEHVDVLRKFLKQLWLPNLFRFTLVRARYSSLGHDDNPYVEKDKQRSKWPVRAGIFFAVGVPFIVNPLLWAGNPAAAWAVLIGAYVGVVGYFTRLDESGFPQTRLLPVISHRATSIGRMTFLFALYALLTYIDTAHVSQAGATWAWDHFARYWALPLFTTFPVFMMLRQWFQHGNADRGRYTNTRIFLTGPFVRYAVFPWGMDYHLPHHLMASVPHYNLRELHALLRDDPEYRNNGVIVEGYVGNDDSSSGRPTLLSVLDARHAPAAAAVYVDRDALEYADVKDAEAIAKEARVSEQLR